MLDYKDIITKHYGLGMKGMAIAKSINASPSGVNDFLRAFKACKKLSYPLPAGITNYGIAEAVYGSSRNDFVFKLCFNRQIPFQAILLQDRCLIIQLP